MILIDSSVWIAAWRGEDLKVMESLAHCIEKGEAVINFLIRTELLQGAKDKRHQQVLLELLLPVPIEPFPDALWNEAPILYLKNRDRGITLTTIDCLIAAHSILSSIPLWSLDKVFQKVSGLKLV